MGNRYKRNGPLGNSLLQRDWKTWIVVDADGEEFRFHRKKYAMMSGVLMFEKDDRTKLYEETTIRTRKDFHTKDEKFRIDITDSLKLRILLNNLK